MFRGSLRVANDPKQSGNYLLAALVRDAVAAHQKDLFFQEARSSIHVRLVYCKNMMNTRRLNEMRYTLLLCGQIETLVIYPAEGID